MKTFFVTAFSPILLGCFAAPAHAEGGNEPVTAPVSFIRQNNTLIPNPTEPSTVNEACLMVSKFKTDVNLIDTADFLGPEGTPIDLDTFRVQVINLPSGKSPTIRLDVLRGTTNVYTHDFSMVNDTEAGVLKYRTSEHIRLVSNAVDDVYRAHQTVLVRLGDTVKATLILAGAAGSIELPVGRPPAEDGSKAIRTADIHFTTLTGIASAPATTIDRMSEDWAQVAIRFNLAASQTKTPVTNVLSITGTANTNGELKVTVTPAGGTAVEVIASIIDTETAEQMATKLAAAISAKPGLTATYHRHDAEWLVLVKKGEEVNFANLSNTVGVTFVEPPLDFTNGISILEGSVLGLNFRDDDDKTIEMIAVTDNPVLGSDYAACGGDYLATAYPGWRNVCIISSPCVDADDAGYPFAAGHEVGHALFSVGDSGHSTDSLNIFVGTFTSVTDTYGAAKRLSVTQGTTARTESGPSTTPALLQKK